MANLEDCVEVIRQGDTYILLDVKGYPSKTDYPDYDPLLGVVEKDEYHTRVKEVIATGDARVLFDKSPETLSPSELHALVAYAAAGYLALEDNQSVIAREAMHELTPEEQRAYSVHTPTPSV